MAEDNPPQEARSRADDTAKVPSVLPEKSESGPPIPSASSEGHAETPADAGVVQPVLFLAEFEDPDALAHACEQVRDAGYTNWDVHTPYPVHGLDQAMGLRTTKIGWISFIGGMIGLVSAVAMIQWMNGVDYPLVVGGKQPDAYPSMVPIMFELGILLTGLSTVFGLLHLCRLPRHHHPVFYSPRFERASDDRFFISIEARDPRFDLEKTKKLLAATSPSHLELVEEEQEAVS